MNEQIVLMYIRWE